MRKYRILVVEDEESINELLVFNLELEGYSITSIKDGFEALKITNNNKFDLVVLDIMLPNVNGFDVCEIIRKRGDKTPILFLSAKSHVEDRVKGLKIGADDYLTKPFNLEEFLLKVKILLERSGGLMDEVDETNIGDWAVDFRTYKLTSKKGEVVELTQKELLLLKLFVNRKGEVVSRHEILDNVWGQDSYPSTRTIDNFIVNFRKIFEKNPKQPELFLSIRGVGYKFVG